MYFQYSRFTYFHNFNFIMTRTQALWGIQSPHKFIRVLVKICVLWGTVSNLKHFSSLYLKFLQAKQWGKFFENDSPMITFTQKFVFMINLSVMLIRSNVSTFNHSKNTFLTLAFTRHCSGLWKYNSQPDR